VKALAVLLGIVAVLAADTAIWYFEPWAASDDSINLSGAPEELNGSACRRLAGLAATLAERDYAPDAFLREFGRLAAGIRPPPRALGDLARGGRNRIVGKGFLARFDDGSRGQARHFAGIAVATTYVGGGSATRWISERLRDDPDSSADGRLTDQGILFASEVTSRKLELDQTPRWLLDHLCRRA
jgi:hypothetical protein